MQADTSLYRQPHILSAARGPDLPIEATQAEHAESIGRYLQDLKVTFSTKFLQTLCDLVVKVQCTQPLFFKRGSGSFEHSVIMRQSGKNNELKNNELFVFLPKRIYPSLDQELRKDTIKIKEAVMLIFGPAGNFLQADRIVKLSAGFVRSSEQTTNVWHQAVLRRIAIMQDIAECPLFPKNHAYIQYRGARTDRVVVFQELALCDLHTFYENKVSGFMQLSQQQKLSICHEIISAVEYLHARGYLHKDIKLENILLFAGRHIKLSDLGFTCKIQDREISQKNCGTLMWVSPEIIYRYLREYVVWEIDKPLDTWGLGLVLYVISEGKPPEVLKLLSKLSDLEDSIQQLDNEIFELENEQKCVFFNQAGAGALQMKTEQLQRVALDRTSTIACLKAHLLAMPAAPAVIGSIKDIATAMLQRDPGDRLDHAQALKAIQALQEGKTYTDEKKKSRRCLIC